MSGIGRSQTVFLDGAGPAASMPENRPWADAFRDALFPPRCLTCGAFQEPPPMGKTERIRAVLTDPSLLQVPMDEVFSALLPLWMCPECVKGFLPVASPLCPVCGIMYAGRDGVDHPCHECIGGSRGFHRARAVGVYALKLMEAVHRLKYEGKLQLAEPLGLLMFIGFCRYWEAAPVDRVVPVPLHPRKMRQRGFNQASFLLRDWVRYSLISGLPGFPFQISGGILIRSTWKRPQMGLPKMERKANIRGAFSVKAPFEAAGKKILLVDDVHTTGATVEACAEVLTKAGASRVEVLTLARTL